MRSRLSGVGLGSGYRSYLRPQSGLFLPFMQLLLVSIQALADNLHQSGIQDCRQREVLVEAPLPAERAIGDRFFAKFRKTQLLERDFRQIESLGTAVIGFAVDAVLV